VAARQSDVAARIGAVISIRLTQGRDSVVTRSALDFAVAFNAN
jgi:hypothetical protein